MNSLRIAASLLLLSLACCASNRPAREVDFKNYSYPWPGQMSEVPNKWQWIEIPEDKVRLVDGKHIFEDRSGKQDGFNPSVSLLSITKGKLTQSGGDYAVVLSYSTGGTANWKYLYVYQIDSGHPRLIALLQAGSRGDGGLLSASIRDYKLVVDFADPDRRTADCCSTGYVRITYRWNGTAFEQEGGIERGNIQPGT